MQSLSVTGLLDRLKTQRILQMPRSLQLADKEPSLYLMLRIAFAAPLEASTILELIKIHPSQWKIWQVIPGSGTSPTYRELAVRSGTRGSLVELPSNVTGDSVELLMEATTPSARRPKIRAWQPDALLEAENYARYVNGCAIGILLFLAVFGVLISLIARDKTFLYFAAWALTSLRTVAVNDGWATNWLFERFTERELPVVLAGSLSLHCLFTTLLFGVLFERELQGTRAGRMHRLLCLAFGSLLVLSPLGDSQLYYLAVWGTAGIGMIFVLYALAVSLKRSTGSSVHRWYAWFWVVTFAGLAGEIAYTAGLFAAPHVLFNVQTGALASALLMAITVAQRFLVERVERRRAQESEVAALTGSSCNLRVHANWTLSYGGIRENLPA